MKTALKTFFITSLFLLLATACSDDDEVTPQSSEGQKEVEKIIKELNKNEDVSVFTEALKEIAQDLNFNENQLTVLAVKNQPQNKSTEINNSFTNQALKRHIIKGVHDFTKIQNDTLILKSISDDIVYATKLNGEIYINGIPLASATATKTGNSIIYVVSKIVPDVKDVPVTKYKITLTIHECNDKWSADNNIESYLLEGATITFYRKNNNNYIVTDSIKSDKDGVAVYNHNYADNLYYTVTKDDKNPLYAGYINAGIFTSQSEIDAYAEYRTQSYLDVVKPGSVRLLDLNGDGFIDEKDKPTTQDYFPVESNANETRFLIETDNFMVDEFYTIEFLKKASNTLSSEFAQYVSLNYRISHRLTNKPSDVYFPQLIRLEGDNSSLWNRGYSYINKMLHITNTVESVDYPKYLREEWNKIAEKHWVEYSYIYASMITYYGDIPLITEALNSPIYIPRTPKSDIIKYIENLEVKAPAVKAVLARIYLNEKDYAKAYTLSKNIVNSNSYSLTANNNVLNSASNSEVILGGYTLSGDTTILKGQYAHPIRYKEILLTMAESSVALGYLQEAVQTIDHIYASNGQPSYTGIYSAENIRSAIKKLWGSNMNKEGFEYMILNRWNILVETLGSYGALSHNNLLPIPIQEMQNNPNMIQNLGY